MSERFHPGDYVTRISHQKDVLFRIEAIQQQNGKKQFFRQKHYQKITFLGCIHPYCCGACQRLAATHKEWSNVVPEYYFFWQVFAGLPGLKSIHSSYSLGPFPHRIVMTH